MKIEINGGYGIITPEFTAVSNIEIKDDGGNSVEIQPTHENRRLANIFTNWVRSDPKLTWANIMWYVERGLNSWPSKRWVSEASDEYLLLELASRLRLKDEINKRVSNHEMAKAIAEKLK